LNIRFVLESRVPCEWWFLTTVLAYPVDLDKLTNHKGEKIMARYSTSSAFNDLVGTCEISNGETVVSYISNTLGPAKVKNLGAESSLNFRLKFDSGSVFGVLASGDIYSFSGVATQTGSGTEPWSANKIPN